MNWILFAVVLGAPAVAFAQESPVTDSESAPAAAQTTVEAAQPSAPADETVEGRFESLEGGEERVGKWEFDGGAELRIRGVRIDPIELSGTNVNVVRWTEMRTRLDAAVRRTGIGGITIQIDALDGVMLGDNGQFVGPAPNSNTGVSLSAKKPNLAGWDVGLRGDDPLTREAYGPVLVEVPPFEINHLYADVNLPIGLLRLGRQPLNYGATITSHDGGRYNRWGVSDNSDSVDRVLFGTKIDEAVKAIGGSDAEPDLSQDNGVILALFHDWMKQDDAALFGDDLRQMGLAVQWRRREADWFGGEWRGFLLSQGAVRLRNKRFESTAYGFPFEFGTGLGPFDFSLQYMHIRGKSREISEGFAALASKPSVRQDIIGNGARLVADWTRGPIRLTLEGDYASGDADPRATTPITSFSFARDLNVGLLMFEHIIAFESARSAAVGIENLSGADDITSFPLTEASTDGRFTNAIAIFPQVRVDWLPRKWNHQVHMQLGLLAAWSAAKGGVVDPIMTSLAEDGERIDDDAVNYHGGRPARFYGTELDLQVGYTFRENFFFIWETGILFPGPALWDEHEDAVNSFITEGRFVVAL